MLNRVIIMGRLTSDPVLKQTPQGVSVTSFNVAIDRNMGKDKERQTDFIPVVAWRNTAEFISKYFGKGKMIIVEGNLRTRTYDDTRHPEVKHYVMEVYADNVSFGETKAASEANGYKNASFPQPSAGGQSQSYSHPAESAPAPSISIGDMGDYEEILGDEDGLPF